MSQKQSLSEIAPLAVGRITRVLFGLGTLAFAAWTASRGGALLEASLWGLLGLSFLLGGLMANPGCELSALPNLFLPREKRFHFP